MSSERVLSNCDNFTRVMIVISIADSHSGHLPAGVLVSACRISDWHNPSNMFALVTSPLTSVSYGSVRSAFVQRSFSVAASYMNITFASESSESLQVC